ncbi:hypothetical protein SAM23877_2399 [Streptomyces ambofaciens ATCC 23877]|uniref:Uncharacterized protein n=1 Tax=Streptomyces ambofaciens (strain ATCC 23877 / 3486 / DSM 40053 / JCM 4204 / NBRC 12836 / NRRL B-2516) TaxID=278992 RepID=A0A0K2AR22_STRA7|nr:hypothetical protein SAM23877_2399 [Streptomyces ambofaciens ATCC 23877]
MRGAGGDSAVTAVSSAGPDARDRELTRRHGKPLPLRMRWVGLDGKEWFRSRRGRGRRPFPGGRRLPHQGGFPDLDPPP